MVVLVTVPLVALALLKPTILHPDEPVVPVAADVGAVPVSDKSPAAGLAVEIDKALSAQEWPI